MRILANKENKRLVATLSACMAAFLFLAQIMVFQKYKEISLKIVLLMFAEMVLLLFICFRFLSLQDKTMEKAVSAITDYLSGKMNVRIECDEEGEMYRLFHSVNNLAAVLNTHAEKEAVSKDFLKNTISDISHQLKTPLAALNIYNGILKDEAAELTDSKIPEFVDLSEHELDRIETLVQNLLKITKLDAGMLEMKKEYENVSDMMDDIALSFDYRIKQEQKNIILNGEDDVSLFCDRDWLIEAVGNIVKNALDHTDADRTVTIEWQQLPAVVKLTVKDDGRGIHPEDMPHIFKRFYRSKFSSDKQGLGLGLSLAKSIIEAHDGTIEADSEINRGTIFTINFLNPTKL